MIEWLYNTTTNNNNNNEHITNHVKVPLIAYCLTNLLFSPAEGGQVFGVFREGQSYDVPFRGTGEQSEDGNPGAGTKLMVKLRN